MARSERRREPVSDEEFDAMPVRIGRHFDRVRDLLDEALDGESEGSADR